MYVKDYMRGGGHVKAFVLIKVEPGKVKDAVEAISGLATVSNVYCITGPDDIIAVLESEDAKSISEVVIAGLHDIEGVKGTDTRMVVELP
jgi:DNA-binding Lrp family transcriptional regulator